MKTAALAAFALLSAPAAAMSDLERFMADEAIPHAVEQLGTHPRFKGETFLFVVFADDATVPESNALALSLRDRLLDAAIEKTTVRLGRRQGASVLPDGRIDCRADDVQYHVGIEISTLFDGRSRVRLRALDVVEQIWVTGFGRSWTGWLTTAERYAYRQPQTDRTFAGHRLAPFADDELDLVATHLARDLSCQLFREGSEEYVIDATDDASDPLVGLVANNLVRYGAVRAAARGEANARLSASSHEVDGSLRQYWVTITPEPDVALATISTSAYRRTDATPATPTLSVSSTLRLLGPLRIRHSDTLSADARADAIVFVLAHQANRGLVRLADNRCRFRTSATLVPAGQELAFPVPGLSARHTVAREVGEWQLATAADRYYAIALRDARAARRLANHIDRLPLRCGVAVRQGLQSQDLELWLTELAALTADTAVDWRAVEVRDVM